LVADRISVTGIFQVSTIDFYFSSFVMNRRLWSLRILEEWRRLSATEFWSSGYFRTFLIFHYSPPLYIIYNNRRLISAETSTKLFCNEWMPCKLKCKILEIWRSSWWFILPFLWI
jgi:hypothetical protein